MTHRAYYNEIDPFAAAWLRQLIKHGHIAPGDVDERSITDVRAADLVGYCQVHFFAGIGGWSLAARLAGIPDDFPLWTGSAPCQPFSAAGAKRGTDDERHLWPIMRDLVAECRPAIVAGEQVASGLGLDWLASVRADLEGEGYAVGAADLCAASVGAPHIRQRIYWGGVRVADAGRKRAERWADLGVQPSTEGQAQRQARQQQRGWADGGSCGDGVRVADAIDNGRGHESGSNRMGDAPSAETGGGRARPAEAFTDRREDDGSGIDRVADAGRKRSEDWLSTKGYRDGWHTEESWDGGDRRPGGSSAFTGSWPSAHNCGWRDIDWLFCRDGKWRPVESGTFPLADGVPARVGRLRGYGNAIVPQIAAAFLRALIGDV